MKANLPKFLSCCLALVCLLFLEKLPAQGKVDSLLNNLDPQKFAVSIQKKAAKLEEKLVKKSLAVLSRLQKEEEKAYSKMLKGADSVQARLKIQELRSKYDQLKSEVNSGEVASNLRQYIPKLDSFTTSLKFLEESGVGGKVKDAVTATKLLQGKFQQAEKIKEFIKERKEQLKQQLEKIGALKQLKQINKQVYYYAAQVKEYREILKDPKKIEKKALELLSKTKIWKDFFAKNSMLAGLFRISNPGDPVSIASLAGLQTRTQVSGLLQQQLAMGGPNAMQLLQQNLSSAQAELNSLKSRAEKLSQSNTEDIMPEGFKPNDQKSKSFLHRLEIGSNIQTQKGNGFWPNSTDLALSIGYKVNEKSVLGFGASYKMGLGTGWSRIRISHQGAGLRSFIDWKIKGSLWITGGYEMNFKSAFNSVEDLRGLNAWQQSGLLGLSKSVPLKVKFFKKTKVQLLWDFLSYRQVPRTESIIFRIGYTIK